MGKRRAFSKKNVVSTMCKVQKTKIKYFGDMFHILFKINQTR